MKEELQFWFHGLGYKEGFDPGEVSHIEVKKRLIAIHAILSAVNQEHSRKIFSKSGGFVLFFYMCDCVLQIAWIK